jgi:hypothetical protein
MEAKMCRLNDLLVLAFCLMILAPNQLLARDDGRFVNSPLKPCFDRVASGKGLCCSFADGVSVQDVDWDAWSLRKYQTTNATTNGHANALIKLVIAVMNGAFYSGFGA